VHKAQAWALAKGPRREELTIISLLGVWLRHSTTESRHVLEASLSRIEFCFGAQCSIEELRSNAEFYSPSTDHFRVIPADTFERFDEDGISSVGMSSGSCS